VELAVATGILGVGLFGLTQLHGSAIGGVARSEGIAGANEVAAQRAELLSTLDADDVAACTGAVGCMQLGGGAFLPRLASAGGFPCTRWVDGADVPDPGGMLSAEGVRFRVDTVVADHPDPARQPRARLLTVSVCWQDKHGTVRQVQTQRLLVPGV